MTAHLRKLTGNPHWVVITVDLEQNILLYGDLFNALIPTAHHDVVNEVTEQLQQSRNDVDVQIDTMIGTLQDRSMQWIVDTVHDISDEVLVLKVHTWFQAIVFPSLHCIPGICALYHQGV